MKKYGKSLLVICFLMFGFGLFAQPGGAGMRDKIETMKIGFITQKLDLSAEEAQRFWPVYNRYTEEQEKSRKAFRGKAMEEFAGVDQMSNADADKALNDMIAFKSSEVELTRKYVAEFKKVLPTQKVVKLFVAEQQFKKELLMQLKKSKGR